MLQVKNLVKRYVTKSGTVTALDHVSVDFSERGMVFLLGKSGSGKSTLLNVSGGLDEPDEGEVIVNGKSSKDFSKSDFDSFRNTYLGFIFQEYNILNELTVEENIALALELQGKPKDKELISSILKQVDLEGLGGRRPTTLSGGQKQRVAIARALIKDPQIIMGDEPTGALDSKTGAQVFDTLKKLSKEKLVVIVSHDRDFAEVYADRIIELRDGVIVSDMSRGEGSFSEIENYREISEKKISVINGADLSSDDEAKIVAFVKKNKGGVIISAEEEDLAVIPEKKTASGFTQTDLTKICKEPEEECNFIKSKFPFRYALKMGVSGLKVKPLRLAFTTLLATVAFIVFGVFSTLLTFTTAKAGASTLVDSPYYAAVLEKHGVLHVQNGKNEMTKKIDSGSLNSHFSDAEVEEMRKKYPSMHYVPAYTLEISSLSYYSGSVANGFVTGDAYYGHFTAFTAFADSSYLSEFGYTLHGKLPQTANECVVSSEIFEVFRKFGYGTSTQDALSIASYDDLIGKSFNITHNTKVVTTASKRNIALTITGVVETGEDFSRYEVLKEKQEGSGMSGDERDELERELIDVFRYSMSALCWVGDGFYTAYAPDDPTSYYRGNVSGTVDTIIEANPDATFSSKYLLTDENGEFVVDRFSWRPGAYYTLYSISPEAEPEGSYVQYLFSPLLSNRSGRSATLFRIDRVEHDNGYFYEAPYEFMASVRESSRDFAQLIAILGTVAVVLAVFAALLLFNFISASINMKKKDIGILRAVGARGIDVYKIFMVEGVAITLLCFLLGSILSWAACLVVNGVMMAQAVLAYKLFLFDWVNVFIVFAIALVTAAVSTIVPVALAVRKKPVEAIRSL